MTEPVQYEFYAPWPLFGKKLSNQWGESRQNSEVLAALVQAAGLDLDDPLKRSDLMSWELGQLDFHNRFRFIYDDVNTKLKIQRNTGTESAPFWVTVLETDYETANTTIIGTFQATGFYIGLNRVELFGLNKIQPDSFYNVQTLYFSSDDGFYFTVGPNGQPVVRLSDRVTGGVSGGGGLSSIAVRSTVSSPTYNTDTIIFDKADFYISPNSSGKPIISLNAEDVSSGISSIAVRSTTNSPTFNTDEVIFDKADFYISPNSSGKPIVSLNAEDTTSLQVKTTDLDGGFTPPTYTTDKLTFDRRDFYLTSDSQGKPVVSLAFEDVDTNTTLLNVTTTDLDGAFTPTDFDTNKLTFNRRDFYLTSDSQGKPIINISQLPSGTGDTIIASGVETEQFPSSVEWQFNHNLNSRPLLWGIYDPGFNAILPDKLDISNPNTAYFYFSEATAGIAIVSTGRVSVDGVSDGFYGITVKNTTGTKSYSGINTVAFHSSDFYIEQNSPNTDEVIVNAKQNTRLNVFDGVKRTYVTDKISFNSDSFYLTGDSNNAPVVNTKDKSFLGGMLTTTQTTNIAVTDHVKFDTFNSVSRRGNAINLNITSPYSTTADVSSIGRISLEANKTYMLYGSVRADFTGNTGTLTMEWTYDFGFGVAFVPALGIASLITIIPTTFGGHSSSQHTAFAVIHPITAAVVELRIQAATALNSIVGSQTYFWIQEL